MAMKGNVDTEIDASIHQNLVIPWLVSRYAGQLAGIRL